MIHEKFRDMFGQADRTTALKRKAVERADRIICISEHTRRDLIELFDVPEEKTASIPLSFGLELSGNRGTAAAAGRELPPYLLYVGSRDFHKNFEGLLRAYASSAALRNEFQLVAFGGPPLSAAEYGLIDRLDIPRTRVDWRRGNDDVLAELYRGAAAFIYPSLYEGFGIPPLEAMSMDCPVICSNTSSIPEVVGDAAELFDPDNTAAMRSAIESVVGSEPARALLIERGRRRIKEFSWDRCASATVKIYSSLLD
jgi:glycosyltransferase involved in cell wall biosynthesis